MPMYLPEILFVIVLGTLMHFMYNWSGKHPFAGLIAPVNESVWEHMKLLFFPMLLQVFGCCAMKPIPAAYPLSTPDCCWEQG